MTNTAKKRSDYKPFPYTVENLNLEFDLHDDKTIVKSTAKYVVKAEYEVGEPLVLNGHDMELLSIKIDGVDVEYSLADESLTIAKPPKSFKLVVETKIHPEKNTSLEGLYRDSPEVGSMFCTQCEAEGFRKITYFPDRPDVLTLFTTRVEADKKKYPYILSNGNKIECGDAGEDRHFAVWQDPWKKPAYLFALVAGDLALISDTFKTSEGREVALEVYVDHHNADKADHAIESLKKSMKWDEDTFGLVYDLDVYMIVATDSFNMGAMENKGLNVFNSKYVLANPSTTTDTGYEGVEGVIGHEYFHNWTGNRVTCQDWFQLTLKEGLTVFRDQEFSSDMQSRSIKRINEVTALRNAQFAEDAGPMAHPIRPDEVKEQNNFYTSTVYNKGAEVIRMIHTMLGKNGFRKGMDLYFKRHDGDAVTCEDFVNAMANANDFDATQFMATWYFQAGTPEIDISWEYSKQDETFTLNVKQTCPATPKQETKQPFHMPLVVGLLDAGGNDIKLESDNKDFDEEKSLLHIKQAEQSFVFKNVKNSPVPSLFRDFSAPVKVTAPYSIDDLLFLMQHDSDDFNRYEACNKIAVELIKTMVEAGEDMVVDTRILDGFSSILKSAKSANADKSILAEMLTLPSAMYVGELMDEINIGLLQKARNMIRKAVAIKFKTELLDLYHVNNNSDGYKFTVAEVGRRALQNTCLGYLLQIDEGVELANTQFNDALKAGNMTDTEASLGGLVNCENATQERTHDLASFYNFWQDDSEVMDKWLSLQATAQTSGTLNVVKNLIKHPAYNETKPNKVRSVIGGFCASGAENFHNIDGSGYDFIANFIIGYDKLNPQVAARLVGVFLRWKRMDSVRSDLMKSALEKIQNSGKLSANVSEIVEKGLV